MTDTTADAVATAADLGRRAADAAQNRRITIDTDFQAPFVVPLRDDEHLESYNPEQLLERPYRARGGAAMHDPASFAAYVTRLAPEDKATSLWADDQQRTITAVFNDHTRTDNPGWRDHTAKLTVRVDPDWAAWTGRDGKLCGQVAFGEFLEDQLHTIVDPPASELVAIATQFTAKRNLTFESSIRLQSGEVAFEYREETSTKTSKGKVEIPERFTIRLAPFVGATPVEVVARLRYRITPEGLMLGYKLTRSDLAEREAFERIVASVVEGTPEGVPMLLGTAPASLRH